MNRDWMRDRLEEFRDLCKGCADQGAYDGRRQSNITSEMATLTPTIREIFKRLDPELAGTDLSPNLTHGAYRALLLARAPGRIFLQERVR